MLLDRLLRPQSIAVVGASPRSFIGSVALRNCLELGYTGALIPVAQNHSEVAGLRGVPSLSAIDKTPDLAVVQVRTDRILPIVREGLEAGVRGFVIPGAGYTDSGADALAVSDGLAALRREYDFEVVGPNCMGVLDLVTRAAPYVGTVTSDVRRGTVAVVAQSGAIIEAFVNVGGRVPLSTAVSSGSEAVTGLADYLDFFTEDVHTSSVLAFIETLTDATRTLAAARRLSEAGKTLAVCIVGHSDTATDGVTAHSGKLAAGARLTTAAFRQAGALIADDLDELMAFGELLGAGRGRPRGRRTHVVTNSGGEGNLIADIADTVGLQLPLMSSAAVKALRERWPFLGVRNPLDPWGADDYTNIYPTAIHHAAQEPGDILLVAMDQHRASGPHERELGRALAQYLHDTDSGQGKFPVLLSPVSDEIDPVLVEYCRKAAIPVLRGARPGLSALAKLATEVQDVAESTRQRSVVVPDLPPCGTVTEDQALDILASMGVTTPRRLRVDNPAEAAAAARTLSTPIVLKGIAPNITHKTERGLVAINPIDVEQSAAEMIAKNPDLNLDFLVVEQIRGELEVIIGYKRDRVFGPTIIVGIGGVWTEFHNDAAVHVGPVDEKAAARLLDESTVGTMMSAARGGALHRPGVLAALRAVSDLALTHPNILSIDINPLIVGRDHATAVDAVIERA
ncbi:acetate--CoA ligase family protein [Rhodococcus koreensis]|nr:acetate--CoA ligase family protein [Rhodococcus koreensis]